MFFPNPSDAIPAFQPTIHVAQLATTSLAAQTWLPHFPNRDNPIWLPENLHHRSIYFTTEQGDQYDMVFDTAQGEFRIEYSPIGDSFWSNQGFDRTGDYSFRPRRVSDIPVVPQIGQFADNPLSNTLIVEMQTGGRHSLVPFVLTINAIGLWFEMKRFRAGQTGWFFVRVLSQAILRKDDYE